MAPSFWMVLLFTVSIWQPGSSLCKKCFSQCPAYWTSYNGHCYRFFGQHVTWDEANYNCQSHGSGHKFANLVSIGSKEENEFVSNLFKSTDSSDSRGQSSHMWIGLTERDERGSFTWTDGTPANFTFWSTEPDTERGEERGGAIVNHNHASFPAWTVYSVSRTLRYTCKMDSFCPQIEYIGQ